MSQVMSWELLAHPSWERRLQGGEKVKRDKGAHRGCHSVMEWSGGMEKDREALLEAVPDPSSLQAALGVWLHLWHGEQGGKFSVWLPFPTL